MLLDLHPAIQARQAHIRLVEPLPSAYGNPTLLHQILLNLLDNAIKFVPQGQRPEVTVRVEGTMPPTGCGYGSKTTALVSLPRRKTYFPEVERLHSPETYPGSGIGLAFVRRAAERLNGQVDVISAPWQGSRS